MAASSGWASTSLWKALLQVDGTRPVQLVLEQTMPVMETVLKSGGTGAPHFTLHDDQHGFRVADRAAELVAAEVVDVMTDVEIALLLMASYAHDIGMTPNRDITKRHYEFIITGTPGLL